MCIIDFVTFFTKKKDWYASITCSIACEILRTLQSFEVTCSVSRLNQSVLVWTVLHALFTLVQLEIEQATGAIVRSSSTCQARFFTYFANAIDWCLIAWAATCFAGWVRIENVSVFTLSASVHVSGTLCAVFSTWVTLMSSWVVNLSFKLTLLWAFFVNRVKEHVISTACASEGRSFAFFARTVTRRANVVL